MKRGKYVLLLIFIFFSTTAASFGPNLSLDLPTNQLWILGFGLLFLMMISAVFLERNIKTVSTKTGPAIGTTLLALSGSLPLLAIAITTALAGEIEIALNNIVGTNIANLTLVLGILAMIKPLKSGKNVAKGIFALIVLLLAIGLIFFAVNPFNQTIEQSPENERIIDYNESFILFGLFVLFIIALQMLSSKHPETTPKKEKNVTIAIISSLIFGFAVCWFANQSVLAFIKLAHIYTIPAFIISSVLVIIGTSLPELAIGFVVLSHKEDEDIFSNLITSDIVNFILCLGIIALFTNLKFSDFLLGFQIPFMLITLLISIKFLYSAPKKITRKEGTILIGIFVAYLFLMSIGFFLKIP